MIFTSVALSLIFTISICHQLLSTFISPPFATSRLLLEAKTLILASFPGCSTRFRQSNGLTLAGFGHSGYRSPRPFCDHCTGRGPHLQCHIGIVYCGPLTVWDFSPSCSLGNSLAHRRQPMSPQCCHGATSKLTAMIIPHT